MAAYRVNSLSGYQEVTMDLLFVWLEQEAPDTDAVFLHAF